MWSWLQLSVESLQNSNNKIKFWDLGLFYNQDEWLTEYLQRGGDFAKCFNGKDSCDESNDDETDTETEDIGETTDEIHYSKPFTLVSLEALEDILSVAVCKN